MTDINLTLTGAYEMVILVLVLEILGLTSRCSRKYSGSERSYQNPDVPLHNRGAALQPRVIQKLCPQVRPS